MGADPLGPIVATTRSLTGASSTPSCSNAWAATPSPSDDQAEQDVLGADEPVVEEACLLLGEDEDSASPIGESFERAPSLAPLRHASGGAGR